MAENQNIDPQKRFDAIKTQWESTLEAMKSVTAEGITEVISIINDHLKSLDLPEISIEIKGKVSKPDFEFTDSFSTLSRALQDKAGTPAIFNGITQGIGGDLKSVNKELSTMMSTLGASGEDMAVVNGIGGALEGLSSIDFKNPVSWVTGTMKALSSIFGIADAKKEAKIVRLQGQIQALANDYKQLAHEMENCYSDEINRKYDEEIANLEQQKAKAEEMARLEASKKKSDDAKVEQYHEQAAQLQREIENTRKAQIEMLAGTSIQNAIDTFADALVEAYARGENGAEALGEKTREVLKKAVKEALKRQFLGKSIEEAVNYLGEAMKDGILSADEKARFEKFVQDAGAGFTKALEAYQNIFLDNPEIESMRGEISKALTETTASKLEGIFRGTYDSVLNVRNATREMLLVQRMGMNNLSELLRQHFLIAMNTRRSADNSDTIRQELRTIHTHIARIAANSKIKSYAL